MLTCRREKSEKSAFTIHTQNSPPLDPTHKCISGNLRALPHTGNSHYVNGIICACVVELAHNHMHTHPLQYSTKSTELDSCESLENEFRNLIHKTVSILLCHLQENSNYQPFAIACLSQQTVTLRFENNQWNFKCVTSNYNILFIHKKDSTLQFYKVLYSCNK